LNKNKIKIQGKTIFNKHLFQAGLWFMSDLCDINGKTIPFQTWRSRGVPISIAYATAKQKQHEINYIQYKPLLLNFNGKEISIDKVRPRKCCMII
jgi:hypothetical protein